MNHLAHIFLAGDSVESLIGNLSGDFVKGPLGDRFPPLIAKGILEHRRIDAYTDSHAAAGSFRRVIAAGYGHYARVISDVFLDHFLACRWEDYSDQSLRDFLRERFALMDPHSALMPPALRAMYPRMRDGRWFRSYATLEGMRTALHHISGRFSRAPRLEPATSLLTERRAQLEADFCRFMPDVIKFAKGLRSVQ